MDAARSGGVSWGFGEDAVDDEDEDGEPFEKAYDRTVHLLSFWQNIACNAWV